MKKFYVIQETSFAPIQWVTKEDSQTGKAQDETIEMDYRQGLLGKSAKSPYGALF